MAKKGDTWMPLYVGDYLADTSRLTTEQHGAYLLLLMDYWRNGPPPDDDEVLACITKMDAAKWRKNSRALREFFDVVDGQLMQKRADQERLKAGVINGKRRDAGKQGAAKRWAKNDDESMANGIANAIANGIAEPCDLRWQNDGYAETPSPSPSSPSSKNAPPAALGPPAEAVEDSKPLTAGDLVAEGIDRQVAADWLKVRKAKKAPLTRTAWAGVKREAVKAEMTPAQAVKFAAERGWQGFTAEWVLRDRNGSAAHAKPSADIFAGAD